MSDRDDERPRSFASPPCFMHEVDPAYIWAGDAEQVSDVRRWRKAERARLIAARLAIAAKARRAHDARIVDRLAAAVGTLEGLIVSAYWPFRGEPDIRPFLKTVAARGGRCALPVVVERRRPLIFRAWAPGDPLIPGIWNIPVPPERAEAVVPNVVLAPVVGFDRACYRLGHGGGYFDRTLAVLTNRPKVLGIGYSLAAIATIYPQWHDIPMSAIVTPDGIVAPASPPDRNRA